MNKINYGLKTANLNPKQTEKYKEILSKPPMPSFCT